jgi:Rrf2 family protein
MLSQRAKYTIRAMQMLATLKLGETLDAGQLATRIKAPVHFLEGILLEMRREGLLQSKRGRSGGYALAKPADLISIADLIRLIDGPLALATCASRTAYARCEDCPTPDDCSLRGVLLDARDAMARVLEESTLANPRPGQGLRHLSGRS